MIYEQLVKLYPKIRVKLGDIPSEKQIIEAGFDIKITAEIKQKLSNLIEGDYLVIMTSTDKTTGAVNGMNLKTKHVGNK